MSPTVRSLRIVAATTLAIALMSGSAAATESEGHRGRGHSTDDNAPPPRVTGLPLVAPAQRPPVKLRSFSIPLAMPLDKGSSGTDASVFLPLPPTPAEQAKLASARAAVERARAAGSLYHARRTTPNAAAMLHQILADKNQRMKRGRSVPLTPDAAAGIGPDLVPVQKQGRPGLSETERLKLVRPSSGTEESSRQRPAVEPVKKPHDQQGGR